MDERRKRRDAEREIDALVNPDPVEELALSHPEVALSQEWISTAEAAALGAWVWDRPLSEATVRRHCRDGKYEEQGIRVIAVDHGYRLNLPDLLRDARLRLVKRIERLEELEEIRRRGLGAGAGAA